MTETEAAFSYREGSREWIAHHLPPVIGIAGNSPGCGKNTVADIFCLLFNGINIAMADALKSEVGARYGLSAAQIDANRLLKELLRPELIHIGQKRRSENPDYWVQQWSETYADYRSQYGNEGVVLVPDVRFDNEMIHIRSLGGIVLYVWDLRVEQSTSITEMFDHAMADYVIPNCSDYAELVQKTMLVVSNLVNNDTTSNTSQTSL